MTTDDSASPGLLIWRRFRSETTAVGGLVVVVFLFAVAIFAPFFVNGRPWLIVAGNSISSPALRDFFAPDAQERFVETLFNWLALFLPALAAVLFVFRRRRRALRIAALCVAAASALPFFCLRSRLDSRDWRAFAEERRDCAFVFAPIPYGPYETTGDVHAASSGAHWLGTDQVGRDVLARMVYGTRVSLAVGVLATTISLAIGATLGLFSGYRGGRLDLCVQRFVEIVICFPTFLLLLILMTIMLDYGVRQSILLVVFVIGFTGWPGLSRLVRGETLKQRQMAYVQSCESLGVPTSAILFRHLLPNVSGPIFVSFAFSIAGAILAENSLSFLGFGVQDPTASWGELLRQAFADPLSYWNLLLWPGLAIFCSVTAFNFIADGIRKAIDLRL